MILTNRYLLSRFSTNKLSKPFKSIRVYKQLSNLELLNALAVNRAANTKWIVANSMKMYKLSCSLLSHRFTNFIIKSTFGRVFTAGETTTDVSNMMDLFQRMKIPVIIDFAGEGFIDKRAVESQLDKNAQMFKKTGDVAIKYRDQMISVKITAIVDVLTLRKLNIARQNIENIWEKYSQNGVMDGKSLLAALQSVNGGITEEDTQKFINQFFGGKGSLGQFKCDRVEFLMNVHPYYAIQKSKNSNKIIQYIAALSKEEHSRLENLVRRLDSIINKFENNTENFRLTIDAEQSYVQEAINSICEQYQEKYNKSHAYVIPTVQNYLKSAKQRMDYEIEIAHRRKLAFGAKHVRGAYIVEQRKLATEKNYQCPIVETFQQTTENYNRNTKLGLTDPRILPNSQMIIATHNQQTINDIQQMMKESSHQNTKLYFAQLQGLADHLTIQLNKEGYNVYKYLPYGATDTMVPYLIRRAQELSQMRYPLTLQYELIVDEVRNRMGLNS